jgi:hypothetical protein
VCVCVCVCALWVCVHVRACVVFACLCVLTCGCTLSQRVEVNFLWLVITHRKKAF